MLRVLAPLLATCFAFSAFAQTERIPPIQRPDIDAFAALLQLDDQQRAAADALHEGYVQEMHRATARYHERHERAAQLLHRDSEEGFDPEAFGEGQRRIGQANADNVAECLQHESRFFDDLRLLLKPEQLERMVRIERMRRRQIVLGEIELSWTDVDLLTGLSEFEIDESRTAELRDAALQYELALDRELAPMLRFMVEAIQKAPEIMADPQSEDARKIIDEFADRAQAIRAVNERHTRLIGVALPTLDRERFSAWAHRRAYPQIYQNDDATPAFDAASGLADLTDEQRDELARLRSRFDSEVDAARKDWADEIDRADADVSGERLMSGGRFGPDYYEAQRACEALTKTYRERIEALLTPEQVERLPLTRQRALELQIQRQQERVREELEARDQPGGGL